MYMLSDTFLRGQVDEPRLLSEKPVIIHPEKRCTTDKRSL
jgi:hypothetical protein